MILFTNNIHSGDPEAELQQSIAKLEEVWEGEAPVSRRR